MEKEFPVKNFRNELKDRKPIIRPENDYTIDSLDKIFNVDRSEDSTYCESTGMEPVTIKVTGFGGQGVLSAGLTIAQAACSEGKHVSWYPSYGPEQRGGSSNCSIVISDETIGTPVVEDIDILIALNKPSLEKFANDVKENGTIIYDSRIGDVEVDKNVNIVKVPSIEIAEKFGNTRTANTALIGVLMELKKTLAPESYENAIKHMFASKPKVIDVNIDVLKAGAKWVKDNS